MKEETNQVDNYCKYIIQSIRSEDASDSVEDKISLLSLIISNKEKILSSSLFFDEDCLFSILNWLWKQRENFTPENFEFLRLNELTEKALLLFEIFPLQIDFFSTNSFTNKFLKIGKLIKNVDYQLHLRFSLLYDYWEQQISIVHKQLLKRKRSREKIDDFEFSNESNLSSSEDTYYSAKEKIIKKRKKVTWKNELIDVICFDAEKPPCQNK